MAETLYVYPTPADFEKKRVQEQIAREAIQNFTKTLSRADMAYVDLPKLYIEEAERLSEID